MKYTDRVVKQRSEWEPWLRFCRENGLTQLTVTTRTIESSTEAASIRIRFEPSVVHAYRLGAE